MSKTTIADIKYGIRVQGIELLSGSLIRPEFPPESLTAFQFNINIEQRVEKENKLVFVLVFVQVLIPNTDTVIGKLEVSNIYEVAEFDEVIKMQDAINFTIPSELVDILNSISLSTTRGVMFSTFKGTILHHAIMPIINPKQMKIN